MSVESLFIESAVKGLQQHCGRIEVCLQKLTDDQIWARGHESENAIGNLALHLAGNVRQWIVSSLGRNPDHRDRDSEFAARGGSTGAQLASKLHETVESGIAVITGLTTDDLMRMHEIQTHKVSGLEAVFHVAEHFAQHTGQIIFVTKMLTGTDLGFYQYLQGNIRP